MPKDKTLGTTGDAPILPWDGVDLGFCWKVQFNRTTTGSGAARRVAGSVTFAIQSLREGGVRELIPLRSDGFTAEPNRAGGGTQVSGLATLCFVPRYYYLGSVLLVASGDCLRVPLPTLSDIHRDVKGRGALSEHPA